MGLEGGELSLAVDALQLVITTLRAYARTCQASRPLFT
jgi:hypothetical protein